MTFLRAVITALTLPVISFSYGMDVKGYANLSPEEKQELFDPYGRLYKENAATFFDLIPLGVQEKNPEVRRRAVQAAALVLQSLQQDPQAGIPASISEQDLSAVTDSLGKAVFDEHAEIRGAAYAALVASEAPNAATENLLLQRLLAEGDDELRGAIVSDMVAAGYQSAAFKRAIINRFQNAESKELKALAAAVERLGITAALPAMLDRLGGGDFAQRSLLSAIRSFGRLAFSSKKKLEEMLADPDGTYPAEVKATLDSLDDAPQPVRPVRPYQSLSSQRSDESIPQNGFNSLATNAQKEEPEKVRSREPSNDDGNGDRTVGAVVVVVALAAIGLAWLLLKKRR